MSADLNTSLKPEAFVPTERASLPVASDVESVYAKLIGSRVHVYMIRDSVSGTLNQILKAPGGDLVFAISDGGDTHFIPHSKTVRLVCSEKR